VRSLLGGLWFAAASLAATLTGQLTDPQAQPVSDAIVKAGTHETRTDSVGRFALPSLAPGNYIVTGSAPEFESVIVKADQCGLNVLPVSSSVFRRERIRGHPSEQNA